MKNKLNTEVGDLQMRKFINEYQYATGRIGPLVGSNLLDPAKFTQVRTVCLPKELLAKFRNDYLLLVYFAALKCGTTIEKLCPFDLLAPFLQSAMEVDDEEI